MKSAEYLAAVKAKLNITSDYALAKALKIKKQTASNYATGKNVPGPVVAFRVAEILGDQPAAVIADFEAERAERAGDDDDVKELRAWASKIAGGAASVLLALGILASPNADARLERVSVDDVSIYRVKRRKGRKAGPFDGLARRVKVALRAVCVTLFAGPMPFPSLA